MSATRSGSDATAGATNAADLGTGLTSAVGSADSVTAQRVQNLNLLHRARLTQLTRTAARVSAQYGAGSTEATAAAAAVTASQATNARIAIVRQQVTTPQPPVSATGWALYGRVFDAQLQPVSGYTVFLVDSQHSYQSAYGFAYTDSSGYFLLNFTGAAAGSQPVTAPAQTSAPLFVAIADAKAQPVFLGTAAFQPILGRANYQNITLPAAGKPIGDPPDAIRRIALPPAVSNTTGGGAPPR